MRGRVLAFGLLVQGRVALVGVGGVGKYCSGCTSCSECVSLSVWDAKTHLTGGCGNGGYAGTCMGYYGLPHSSDRALCHDSALGDMAGGGCQWASGGDQSAV